MAGRSISPNFAGDPAQDEQVGPLFALALLALAAAKSDGPVGPLELALSTDKPAYASGEPIALLLSVHNRGTRPVTIVHPDFWGVSTISVTTGGKPATPDSETRTHRFDTLTAWTCCYGYTFHPLPAGRHQIVVTVTNPPEKVTPPSDWKPDWTGTVSSPPLTIEVRKAK
jgi:hypothetical protein